MKNNLVHNTQVPHKIPGHCKGQNEETAQGVRSAHAKPEDMVMYNIPFPKKVQTLTKSPASTSPGSNKTAGKVNNVSFSALADK